MCVMVNFPRRPETLLVASGKGGVGTSILATLIALSAAHGDQRVLLVDATESGGTLHHLFGARPARSLWMLARPNAELRDTLIAIDETLNLVAGGTAAGSMTPKNDDERRAALATISQVFGAFDLVVIDGGSRLDTVSAIVDTLNPQILLATSADRLSLAANYALVKALRARRDDLEISIVANRNGVAVAEEACEFLIGACTHFLGRSIEIAGVVPDDPCLQAAIGAGMSVRDALDGSPAADAARDVLKAIVPSWPNAVPSSAATMSSPSLPAVLSPSHALPPA
jgi:MinD-like ATPase involved in chromosome partitioning or flagellar assembly